MRFFLLLAGFFILAPVPIYQFLPGLITLCGTFYLLPRPSTGKTVPDMPVAKFLASFPQVQIHTGNAFLRSLIFPQFSPQFADLQAKSCKLLPELSCRFHLSLLGKG
jgi:hypothetical protein